MVKEIVATVAIILVSQKLSAQRLWPNKQLPIDSLKNLSLKVVASNYYSSNLPFFCKQELQIQKLARVPIKFRIGSVEEVDKLEGKHSGKP